VGVGPWLSSEVADDGPGPWRVGGCPVMSRALTDVKLTDLGYLSLFEHYLGHVSG
jgi:hypothetical protein